MLLRALPHKGLKRYQFKDYCDIELLNMACTCEGGGRCQQGGSYIELGNTRIKTY